MNFDKIMNRVLSCVSVKISKEEFRAGSKNFENYLTKNSSIVIHRKPVNKFHLLWSASNFVWETLYDGDEGDTDLFIMVEGKVYLQMRNGKTLDAFEADGITYLNFGLNFSRLWTWIDKIYIL